MKRRILLVDDEVAVLLTLKAVLEISGFDVDTATSAREGKSRIRHREYEMIITDMRMEDEHAGREVIAAAKEAPYKPAIALLTAFPEEEDAVGGMGADKMLVKPMHTRILLQQLEALFAKHHGTVPRQVPGTGASGNGTRPSATPAKPAARKSAAKKLAATKVVAKKAAAKNGTGAKPAAAKKAVKAVASKSVKKAVKATAKKAPARKAVAKR